MLVSENLHRKHCPFDQNKERGKNWANQWLLQVQLIIYKENNIPTDFDPVH